MPASPLFTLVTILDSGSSGSSMPPQPEANRIKPRIRDDFFLFFFVASYTYVHRSSRSIEYVFYFSNENLPNLIIEDDQDVHVSSRRQ